MNQLQQFLLENTTEKVTQEIVVSDRLKDFKFTIKAMTGAEYADYQKRCITNPGSAKKRSFDSKKFNELIVINNTVEPNFKDAEFIHSAGVMDSASLMYKTLLAGEISTLAERILELSGFGQDMDEVIEEAKN